jgi:23S rRNA pseudouridine2605 synthase
MVARGNVQRSSGKSRRQSIQKSSARTATARTGKRSLSIARALSKQGFTSRKEAERMIAEGRVSIGGYPIRDPNWRVDPALDPIEVDAIRVPKTQPEYWVLNKRAGALTPHTLRHHLAAPACLKPAGRLDVGSEGLVVFSNNNLFLHWFTSAESGVAKVYEVLLDAPVERADAKKLESGVTVRGCRTSPARVVFGVGARRADHMRIVLTDGRSRQVRRMLDFLGRKVLQIRRVAIGPIRIGDLATGGMRRLIDSEMRALVNMHSRFIREFQYRSWNS